MLRLADPAEELLLALDELVAALLELLVLLVLALLEEPRFVVEVLPDAVVVRTVVSDAPESLTRLLTVVWLDEALGVLLFAVLRLAEPVELLDVVALRLLEPEAALLVALEVAALRLAELLEVAALRLAELPEVAALRLLELEAALLAALEVAALRLAELLEVAALRLAELPEVAALRLLELLEAAPLPVTEPPRVEPLLVTEDASYDSRMSRALAARPLVAEATLALRTVNERSGCC